MSPRLMMLLLLLVWTTLLSLSSAESVDIFRLAERVNNGGGRLFDFIRRREAANTEKERENANPGGRRVQTHLRYLISTAATAS